MRIRNARKEDIDIFVDIYKNAYEGLEEYAYTSRKEIRRYFKWLYGRDKNGFFFAEIKSPVGFIAIDTSWFSPFEMKKVGEIHEIAVIRSFWGRGVGSKLVEKAMQYAKSRGRSLIELWVGDENFRARRFYEKFGFSKREDFGKWIRMVKKI